MYSIDVETGLDVIFWCKLDSYSSVDNFLLFLFLVSFCKEFVKKKNLRTESH